MIPSRISAALGACVLWLTCVPAAGAQSLLSMPPQEWTTVVAAGDAGARYLARLPEPPSLFALLDMVERGRADCAWTRPPTTAAIMINPTKARLMPTFDAQGAASVNSRK